MFYRNDRHEKQIAMLEQRMAWLKAVKGKSSVTIINVHRKKICSAHFVSGNWNYCIFLFGYQITIYSELCTGEKAGYMDKDNQDWTPSIGLPEFVDSDVNDFPDSMPNSQLELDELEFDHTLIHK